MNTTVPHDPTVAHATKQAPLGSRYLEPARSGSVNRGDRVWVYILNDGGEALAQGDVVIHKAATSEFYTGDRSAALTAKAGVLGVAQFAIPDDYYGYVLERGVGYIKADDNGGDQADDPLVPGAATAGAVDVMAAGEEHCVIGYGIANAAASAGALFLANICAGW